MRSDSEIHTLQALIVALYYLEFRLIKPCSEQFQDVYNMNSLANLYLYERGDTMFRLIKRTTHIQKHK